MRRLSIVLLAGLLAAPAQARDIVYQPVSPNFGGNPLNGAFVLGIAGANNRFTVDPRARAQQAEALGLAGDPTQAFARQITSSLLAQIAATISQQIIGENARDSGLFAVGGTTVQFNRVGGQINIDITDAASGGRTNIQLPAPQF